MHIKTAVTIGLAGALLQLVTQFGFIVGGQGFTQFIYDSSIGSLLMLLPELTLLIFFIGLRIKQK